MCFNPSAQVFLFFFLVFSFFRLVLGILICNFHNFTGRTQTHTRTHKHSLNLIFTLDFYEARSTQKTLSLRTTNILRWFNFLKNSRATSTADDAHLSCGCGATVARGSRWRYTRWIAGLSMFDATCSRKTNRTGASGIYSFTFTHLKFE